MAYGTIMYVGMTFCILIYKIYSKNITLLVVQSGKKTAVSMIMKVSGNIGVT